MAIKPVKSRKHYRKYSNYFAADCRKHRISTVMRIEASSCTIYAFVCAMDELGEKKLQQSNTNPKKTRCFPLVK